MYIFVKLCVFCLLFYKVRPLVVREILTPAFSFAEVDTYEHVWFVAPGRRHIRQDTVVTHAVPTDNVINARYCNTCPIM